MHTPPILPRKNPQHAATGQISDLQFLNEIPDEPSAEAWFMVAWGQKGDFPNCSRCERGDQADFTSPASTMPYWCKRCGKPFSMKLETLMGRSPLGLKKWAHILHVWTGGDGPSSADELERRCGLADATGDGVSARLLRAAREEVTPLDQDCVLWWFRLGNRPRSRAYVVTLKGCDNRRTVIGKLSKPPGRDGKSLQDFLVRNLQGGSNLFLDNPNLARHSSQMSPRSLSEVGDPSLSSTGLRELQERVEAIINDVYRGVQAKNLDQYLAGIQWWENYGHLSHRERSRKLALQLRYKPVPRLKGSNKQSKKRQSEPSVYQWADQQQG